MFFHFYQILREKKHCDLKLFFLVLIEPRYVDVVETNDFSLKYQSTWDICGELRHNKNRDSSNPVFRATTSINGVIDWLLFNANSAIFQLYHGENKLILYEMMMISAWN